MKKAFFFLTAFIGFVVCVYAQNLQRSVYNDGKILVYIEQRKAPRQYGFDNGKNDHLIIENISDNEVTVNYSYRAVKTDEKGLFEQDKMVYRKETLKPKEKKQESGYAAHNGKIGFYYVDSFAIMNVSVRSNSSSSSTPSQPNTETQQAITVPSWAQGTWYANNIMVIITSTQFLVPSIIPNPADCYLIDGDKIFFGGTDCMLQKTNSPNQIILNLYVSDTGWQSFTLSK